MSDWRVWQLVTELTENLATQILRQLEGLPISWSLYEQKETSPHSRMLRAAIQSHGKYTKVYAK